LPRARNHIHLRLLLPKPTQELYDHHVSAHDDRCRTRRAGDQDLRPGRHGCARARQCRRRVRAGALHRDHGPVRVREVDVAALHRRPRPAHERRGVARCGPARAALREGAHEGRRDKIGLSYFTGV
jgi:hypothetical protein